MTPYKESVKFCLLGVSFNTGNMGVSALAVSTVKCLLEAYPNAIICLLNYGENDGFYELKLADRTARLKLLNMSFSKRIWKPNHYFWQLLLSVLYRFMPFKKLRKKFVCHSKYLQAILESDVCFDISAGDSFSDIYGLYRLFYICSCKLLVLLLKKKLFLLPQTYGPFQMGVSKILARYILKRADAVYARDRLSKELVDSLLNGYHVNSKVRLLPDVAFVMDTVRPTIPEFADLEVLSVAQKRDAVIVGLNISGLLWNGGYTRNNMFGLNIDYRETVYKIIELLIQHNNVLILLVPHVFLADDNLESDVSACSEVYEITAKKYAGRLFMVRGEYNQSEIKYTIGMCDFFIGSRMHSCIAALSQCIPTIGLAYSRKFYGVFDTLGLGKFSIDMCQSGENDILDLVSESFNEKKVISQRLKNIIPDVQKQILETIGNCIEK